VRQEDDGIRRYCHVGTGNYNEKTARTYEDIGLLTCDPEIGADLSQLFNYLTGYGRQERFRRLLVAPGQLRPRLLQLIANETRHGKRGRITIKVNGIDDAEMIDALYEASQAGVKVELIVRSICCLRPGVPGLSETISVRSIVGRYLEHSRVFCFANGRETGKPAYYIGSADLRSRNLDKRVEALVPVDDRAMQVRLREILDANLADDELAWELLPDGSWRKVVTRHGISTHKQLAELALDRSKSSDMRIV
jgi:polyphosphate kinase